MTELSFEDSKILVIGGAGFVGSNLVLSLLEKPSQITIVDNLISLRRRMFQKAQQSILLMLQ